MTTYNHDNFSRLTGEAVLEGVEMFSQLNLKSKIASHCIFYAMLACFVFEKYTGLYFSPLPKELDTMVFALLMVILPWAMVPISEEDLKENSSNKKK